MALGPEGQESPALLPCGRDPLDVWDDLAVGIVDDHERRCPYCQGVAAERAALAGPTRALIDERLEPPPSLLDRVMSSVSAARLHRRPLDLPSPLGRVTVDAATAATILRWAVDDLADVRAVACEIDTARPEIKRDTGTDASGQHAAATPVVIRVKAEVRIGVNVREMASTLRSVMGDVASRLIGLEVRRIDVDIEDLFGIEELLNAEGAPTGR